jgi:hypothetical protein
MFVLIGFPANHAPYKSYNAGTPINENNPNDARASAYYNREQYPSPALLWRILYMYAGLDPDDPYTDEKPKYAI